MGTPTICIFTNQRLREKIGVMFEFTAGTRVVLADGTTEKIGKIVNQKLDVEVLSMNPETREIVDRRYFKNGQTDEWLRFEVAAVADPGAGSSATRATI